MAARQLNPASAFGLAALRLDILGWVATRIEAASLCGGGDDGQVRRWRRGN
jgi:hypothetical protein